MNTRCPNCKKTYLPELVRQDAGKVATWMDLRKDRKAKLIQDEWPDATTEEREQLLTGMCSDACWEAFLGPEE